MRSADRGHTWDDLGIILDAPPGTEACDSANRFVLGGVGDVTAALDADSKDVYLYFSQYSREPRRKASRWRGWRGPIAIEPVGKVDDLERRRVACRDPAHRGTPLVRRARQPFHDRSATNDVFWGPSIHWNTYLEQYVMLLNRAKDDQFGQDGIYVSYSPTLSRSRALDDPAKIFNGGDWYPQVIGTEIGTGTDRIGGQTRAILHDRPLHRLIEFER